MQNQKPDSFVIERFPFHLERRKRWHMTPWERQICVCESKLLHNEKEIQGNSERIRNLV